jgi:hypothetical protein
MTKLPASHKRFGGPGLVAIPAALFPGYKATVLPGEASCSVTALHEGGSETGTRGHVLLKLVLF